MSIVGIDLYCSGSGPTLALPPDFFPLFFLAMGLLEVLGFFSGAGATGGRHSSFPLAPLFLASSSGWMLGRTPPAAIVTPFSSCHTQSSGFRVLTKSSWALIYLSHYISSWLTTDITSLFQWCASDLKSCIIGSLLKCLLQKCDALFHKSPDVKSDVTTHTLTRACLQRTTKPLYTRTPSCVLVLDEPSRKYV